MELKSNPITKVLTAYQLLFKKKAGFPYRTVHGKDQALLKRLLEQYNEMQLIALLIVYFNWYGMSGSEEKEQQFIAGTAYALTMFASNTAKYEMYARNVASIPLDNEQELEVFVSKHMKDALG